MKRALAVLLLAGCGAPEVVWDCYCTATCTDSSTERQDVGSICASTVQETAGDAYRFALRRCGALPVPCKGQYVRSLNVGCDSNLDQACQN